MSSPRVRSEVPGPMLCNSRFEASLPDFPRRLMTVADYPGLNDATGQAIEELADQDANPSSPRLDSAEAVSVGRGAWG
jgi:hypothetical protein